MKKLTLALLALTAFVLRTYAFSGEESEGPGPRPNIIIIYMDDMGYGDPECYNGLLYHTPNINKLAAEGMRFTNFYSAQAVCTASRAALLTGCYPNRIGMVGALMPWDKTCLNPKEETIAKALQKAGYHTGMVGKWHLGSQAPYLPLHYGFDEYLGLPYSNDMWPVGYDGKPVTDTSDWKSRYPPLPLLDGDKPVRYIRNLEDQSTLTQVYTQRAVEFIQKSKDKPFFLYLAHSMVHVPIAASPAFRGKSKEGLFGDVMMEVDWSVGQIMKTLDEQGLTKNTWVIFTSDNGPWRIFGDHAGNTAGLREGKGTSFEGGQREPCIMRWPGVIPAGVVSNGLAVNIDLLPTILHVCQAPLPVQKIDGVDIGPLIRNEEGAHPREELVYYYQRNSLEAVRKGQWNLVFPHQFASFAKDSAGRNGFPTRSVKGTTDLALFDLRDDPGETVDVKAQFPAIVTELQAVADKYRQMLGDDLTKTPSKEFRAPARSDAMGTAVND